MSSPSRRGIVASLQEAARRKTGTEETTMNTLKRLDTPGIIFGMVLVFAGAYYVLRNSFGLPLNDINWDLVWPFIVVALGGSVLFKSVIHPRES